MLGWLELTTLSIPGMMVAQGVKGAIAWNRDTETGGELIGCWHSDVGTIGQVYVLRSFQDLTKLNRDRERALMSANPFNVGSVATAIDMVTYRPFDFLPPPKMDPAWKIFELRTYRLKPGGLPATLAGWKQAIEPAAEYTKHLVINMYSLDGTPRITHLWGFSDVGDRFALRSKVYQAGLWPPKGGPENISEATSTLAVPHPVD